jgi:two-component system response regulator YesN
MFKLLLVEDERLTRQGLVKTIRRRYPQGGIVEARNGKDALDLFRKHQPNVVLTDIKMPGMDGLEMIGEIRKLDTDVPIIIISGFSDFAYAKKAITGGVTEYLLKPLDEDELYGALQKALEFVKGRGRSGVQAEKIHRFRDLLFSGKESPPAGGEEHEYVVAVSMLRAMMRRNGRGDDYGRVFDAVSSALDDMDGVSLEGSMGELVCVLPDEKTFYCLADSAGLGEKECFFGLSQCLPERLLSLAYKQAAEAAGLWIYGLKGRMAWSEYEKQRSSLGAPKAADIFSVLVQGNSETIKKESHDMMDHWMIHRLSAPCLSKHLLTFFEDIEKRAYRIDNTFFERFSLSPDWIRRMCWTNAIEDIRLQVKDLLLSISSVLHPHTDGNEKRIIAKVRAYIEEHNGINISLTDCAAHAGLNPAYLSHLYKRNTGENFLAYIIGIRMSKAVDMLLHDPDKRIYEVANYIGYNDVKYFNRVFQRMFSMSPGEYRETHGKGGKKKESPARTEAQIY